MRFGLMQILIKIYRKVYGKLEKEYECFRREELKKSPNIVLADSTVIYPETSFIIPFAESCIIIGENSFIRGKIQCLRKGGGGKNRKRMLYR